MNKKYIITLGIVIVFIAFFIRIIWITQSPPSLNWDEVALGYNAFSLLKTGKDEYGSLLPIVLRSFDDYKPALYAYLSVLPVKIFGLTELGARMISIFSGVISTISLMFLSYQFFGKYFKSIFIFTGLLSGLSIWGIFFSRAAFESNLGLSLILIGLAIIVNFQKGNKSLQAIGYPFLALSMHSYVGYKILSPLVIVLLLFYFRKNVQKNIKPYLLSGLITLLIVTPLAFMHLKNIDSANRLTTTTYIKKGVSIDSIFSQFTQHYLSYFSPINLFQRGSPEPTQQIPNMGMFYPVESLFILLGSLFVIKQWRKNTLFLSLLGIFPFTASLTWNWFYPARVLPFFAFLTILSGLGLSIFVSYVQKQKALTRTFALLSVSIIAFINISNFCTTYFLSMPYSEAGSWQYGMKEILTEVSKYDKNYTNIVIETRTAQPHIFTLFYTKFDPSDYQREINKIGGIPFPRKSYDFSKFKFRDVYWPTDKYVSDTLLVGPESSLPEEKVKQNKNLKDFVIVKDRWGNTLAHIVGLR